MATEKEIRRRIKSASNIKKITRAMQMVAASKMRKAQEKALTGKVYARIIFQMAGDLSRRSDPSVHPLLTQSKVKTNKQLIVLISTNKGLCGALNTNLFRFTEAWYKTQKDMGTDFITVGKKGQAFVVYLKAKYIADFSDVPMLTESIGAVSRFVEEQYFTKQYDEIFVSFSDFENALSQKPVVKRLLPISLQELINEEQLKEWESATGKHLESITPEEKQAEERMLSEFLIEPSVSEVLDALLDTYVEIQLRDAILEAEASEYSARMIAMKNATDNAGELIDGLTLEYNKTRQANITNELLDITTAKLSLETNN